MSQYYFLIFIIPVLQLIYSLLLYDVCSLDKVTHFSTISYLQHLSLLPKVGVYIVCFASRKLCHYLNNLSLLKTTSLHINIIFQALSPIFWLTYVLYLSSISSLPLICVLTQLIVHKRFRCPSSCVYSAWVPVIFYSRGQYFRTVLFYDHLLLYSVKVEKYLIKITFGD